MKTKLFLFVTALSISLSPVFALELAGVKKADHISLAGKNLVLNGIGLREATLFNIHVYVGSLYLESPSSNPEEILTSPQFKRVEMNFLRSVDAKKISGAWTESYEKNCAQDCARFKQTLQSLNASMTDMAQGDMLAFNFLGDLVEIEVRGKKVNSISNATFGKILLSTWLGPYPPNKRLKTGMLTGKND